MTTDRGTMDKPPLRESFAGIAGLYEEHRPGYTEAAIAAIVERFPPPVRVADIGCGTGIASRLLAARGAAVIGIEPNPDMIEQAKQVGASPGESLDYRRATGEETGLPDASVDVVVCAQSFQWLAVETALREFHRILRSGGRLALMWNMKSDTDAFTVGFSRILKRAQTEAKRAGQWQTRNRTRDPSESSLFENVRKRRFANPQRFDLDGVLGRAHSASFFPRRGNVRQELEGQLRTLFEEHARDGQVTLWQETELTLADKRG